MPKLTPNFQTYKVDTDYLKGKTYSKKAAELLEYGIACAQSFHELFEIKRSQGGGGNTSHSEQDLLRSMIVFSAATLDITVKQVIKEILIEREKSDIEVSKKFKEYIQKILSRDDKNELLAEIFLIENTKNKLMEMYISHLTGSSLQSLDELLKVAALININLSLKKDDKEYIKEIFNARNQIIHELDYDFSAVAKKTGVRKRNQRKMAVTIKQAEKLLEISRLFIELSAI